MHRIIAKTCARSRNFSNSRPACSPSSFVARRDGFRGSWDDSSRFVASTRTSDRKFHVDNLQELAAESVVGGRKEKKEKHFSKIMFWREANFNCEKISRRRHGGFKNNNIEFPSEMKSLIKSRYTSCTSFVFKLKKMSNLRVVSFSFLARLMKKRCFKSFQKKRKSLMENLGLENL